MKRNLTIIIIIGLLGFGDTVKALWQRMAGPDTSLAVFAIANLGANLFAATSPSGKFHSGATGMYRSNDFGASWTRIVTGLPAHQGFYHLTTRAGLDLLADEYDSIFRSSDNGDHWAPANHGIVSNIITGITSIGSAVLAACASSSHYEGGWIFRSTDRGVSWTQVYGPGNCPMVLTTIGSSVFAGTSYGHSTGFFRSIDSGVTWTEKMRVPNPEFSATAFGQRGSEIFFGSDNRFASPHDSVVYTSDDDGYYWSPAVLGLPSKTSVNAFATWGREIFAGTTHGVFQYRAGTRTWIPVSVGLRDSDISSLVILGDYLFAGTSSDGVYRRPLSEMPGMNEVSTHAAANNSVRIFPNPTTGLVTLDCSAKITQLQVSNLLGQSVIEQSNPGTSNFTIDISKLSAGTYFAKLTMPGALVVKKIVRE